MALDLILRNAKTVDSAAAGDPLLDIGVQDGRIVAMEPGLKAEGREIDVGGKLVSPGLCETHIHLDKSQIVDRCAPAAGRARDHMQRVAAVKPGFTVEDVYQRARKTLEGCILNGTMHMRTHVEVDPNVGTVSVEALLRLAKDYAWAIDLELCAFAQEGWSDIPEADANVVRSLDMGCVVVGGAPGYDRDHGTQIRRIFELAKERDLDIDIHLDVGPNADDLDIHLVCDLTDKIGWGGRVAIGHGAKYSLMPIKDLQALGRKLADTGVAVTVLPATDLFVMGRHQEHSIMRGVTDANTLVACGANCSLSTNNVLNPFTPFGDCSLIRMANLYANIVQRGNPDELAECFEMMTRRSARLLRREDYGVEVGKTADLVVWNATQAADAVATIALPLMGFKRGRQTFSRDLPVLHRP